jgi:hypothetical protein
MKYCTNCKAEKLSYTEKGCSGTNYENRCWNCDKYTLVNKCMELTPSYAGSVTKSIANALGGDNLQVSFKQESGTRYEQEARIEYFSQSITFKKG